MLTLTNVNVVAGRTLAAAAAAVGARHYSSMVFMESDGSTPTPTPEAYVLQYVSGVKLATASPPMEVRARKYVRVHAAAVTQRGSPHSAFYYCTSSSNSPSLWSARARQGTRSLSAAAGPECETGDWRSGLRDSGLGTRRIQSTDAKQRHKFKCVLERFGGVDGYDCTLEHMNVIV